MDVFRLHITGTGVLKMNSSFKNHRLASGLVFSSLHFSSVQSLSQVWLFATPWTAAYQASLSITKSWSFIKLMSIESAMPSNHLIPCPHFSSNLQSFPGSGSSNESVLHIRWPKYWSFSFSISQDWFPLGLTGLILQSKGLSRVFSNNIVQKHQFFSAQLSL